MQTFTSPTAATKCPSTAQVVIPGTTTCSSTADASGNFAIYAAPQTLVYQINNLGTWSNQYVEAIGGGGSSNTGNCIATVSTLTSACGAVAGRFATVVDGINGSDCTVGGGTNSVACIYNGPLALWVFAGGSTGGSAGFPTVVTNGANTSVAGTDCTGATDSTAGWNSGVPAGSNVFLPAGCVLKFASNLTIPGSIGKSKSIS